MPIRIFPASRIATGFASLLLLTSYNTALDGGVGAAVGGAAGAVAGAAGAEASVGRWA